MRDKLTIILGVLLTASVFAVMLSLISSTVPSDVYGQGTKVTAMTADTAPTSDDLTYTVNDPGGTPASRKTTLSNLTKGLEPASTTVQGVVAVGSQTLGGIKTIQSAAAGDKPLILKLHASQSANSFEINTAAGSNGNVFRVDLDGDVVIARSFNAGTTIHATTGYTSSNYLVTATADGLTTGLITLHTSSVSALNGGSVNNIITLPSESFVGFSLALFPIAGCELRTPASTNITVNNVDCDGTNELALVANNLYYFVVNNDTNWIAYGYDNTGTELTPLAPHVP